MDAVKYLKERDRMCGGSNCLACPLYAKNNGKEVSCQVLGKKYAEDAVAIVEKWSAAHPAKTRQSEFLKIFPNARLDEEKVISICPESVDSEYGKDEVCMFMTCHQCRKEYWTAEVESTDEGSGNGKSFSWRSRNEKA